MADGHHSEASVSFKIKVDWNKPQGRTAGTACVLGFSQRGLWQKIQLLLTKVTSSVQNRLPNPISSCPTSTFCSLCLLGPFPPDPPTLLSLGGSQQRERERESECVCVCVCVLAGSRSQLRDKAPLHTANSSLLRAPTPSTGTHTYKVFNPQKTSHCASNSRPPALPPLPPSPPPPQSFLCPPGFVR